MRFKLVFLVSLLAVASPADAAGFELWTPRPFDDGRAIQLVGTHHAAFRGGALGFDDALRRILGTHVGSRVGIKAQARGQGGRDFRFYVGDVPVCDYQVRGAELKGRRILALGQAPQVKVVHQTAAYDWPSLGRVGEVAAAQLEDLLMNGTSVTVAGAERCYAVKDGEAHSAWNLRLMARGLPYAGVADENRVYRLDRLFFDVDGKAQVYPENKVATPTLTEVPLVGLVGNGKLETEFLKTTVEDGYLQASEADHDFTYPEADERFQEVATFAHAVAHFEFFQNLGFEYYDVVKPLVLQVHKPPGGSPNNALFSPSIGGSAPVITIGDGDGVTLTNLTLDGDVVSHELGHLVVFEYLISTSGHSLALHEGLADFFTFARTGNACLGESICPPGSQACHLVGECLRSAEVTTKYDDDEWQEWMGNSNKLGHLHGQVISGMLWDLHKSGEMPLALLTETVMKAVHFLPEKATFGDWLAALLTANQEISGKTYDAEIREAATARGLAEFLPKETASADEDLPEEDSPPAEVEDAAPAQDPAQEAAADEPVSKKKDRKKVLGVSCGTLGSEPADEGKASVGAGALLLIGLCLPVILGITSSRGASNRGS